MGCHTNRGLLAEFVSPRVFSAIETGYVHFSGLALGARARGGDDRKQGSVWHSN